MYFLERSKAFTIKRWFCLFSGISSLWYLKIKVLWKVSRVPVTVKAEFVMWVLWHLFICGNSYTVSWVCCLHLECFRGILSTQLWSEPKWSSVRVEIQWETLKRWCDVHTSLLSLAPYPWYQEISLLCAGYTLKVRQSLLGYGWQKRLSVLLQLLSRQGTKLVDRRVRGFKDMVTLKRLAKSQNHFPAPLWHIQRCKDALTSLLPEHPSLRDWATVNEAEQVALQVPVPQVATLAGGSGKLN